MKSKDFASAQNAQNAQNPFINDAQNALSGQAFGNFGMHTKNPFAAPVYASDEVPDNAPEGSYTYALVKNGPDVPAEECEVPVSSLQVLVRWGTSVLALSQMTPPRSFFLGEESASKEPSDCLIPAELLGASRAPLLLVDAGGTLKLVLLAGMKGRIEIPGEAPMSLEQVKSSGRASPYAALPGANCMVLPHNSKAMLSLDAFSFEITAGNAGKAVFGRFNIDGQVLPYQGLSTAIHLGLLAAMAFFMPPLGSTDEGSISAEQQYILQTKLDQLAEKELERKEEMAADANKQPEDRPGGTGAAAIGESGAMGSQTSRNTGGRYAIEGPKDNTDVHVARAAALRDAASFGMIGLIQSGLGGDPNAPIASFGRPDSLGNDDKSALGNMWGNTIDESAGAGGLGLTGVGEGGGSRYEGIGMGSVGTVGHGAGLGKDQGFGPGGGSSFGRTGRTHAASAPRVRNIGTQVSGRLPPEVIQRIVRQNFGRFRLCYENGLRNNPNLQGRVGVRFVIGRDGAVSSVANGGSDLPDSAVVSCVVRAFYGLSFPQPEEGIVTVTYPIMFSPGE